jgi:5'-methylthioadenosine phosphorylase
MAGPHITPQHIKAGPDDVSARVVVVGDPARARMVAGMLEDSRLVNENRGLLVYTGYHKGRRITVAVHGIGAPSAAIVVEELIALGARYLVRLGTCGGLVEDLDIGDFVVASGAAYNPGGTLGQYFDGICPPASPDPELLLAVYREASARGRAVMAPVYSSDAFYAEDPGMAKRLASLGIKAVEMEVATLYALSTLRGVKAAALLVVSDNLVVPGKERLRSHEELAGYVEKAAEAVLEALASVGGVHG